ncbi:molybdenum cofactor sulfurase [Dictyobacter alpinus]|uniref:Molybdenum cofactor sulfurase n=1 Tax=Dictyobacter alpinus TaxID=2014873 RepID=A0A402B296_9CHLR|nr:MOSC domain-containing protein [Dictyobacter alpinus]GCE25486.1 molybdenum cofactor sulfurase [Dictyobacter alpinus]
MTRSTEAGTVVAVCRNQQPGLPKPVVDEIMLQANWGVEGDYHAGKLVRHRYLARKYPNRPNKRQVLLVDVQSYTDIAEVDIQLGPGAMGENITVQGLAVMQLPLGTHVSVGEALLEITEVRTPCKQLNGMHEQLLQAVTTKEQGKKCFKAGMMARILRGGRVRAGDQICIQPDTALTQPQLFP